MKDERVDLMMVKMSVQIHTLQSFACFCDNKIKNKKKKLSSTYREHSDIFDLIFDAWNIFNGNIQVKTSWKLCVPNKI